jgi:hypothetical protein
MLRMVMAINSEHLKGVGNPAAGRAEVTCYTPVIAATRSR